MKVYKSKNGLKFALCEQPTPTKDETVFFTAAEFSWIKAQNFTAKQFEFVWQAKKEDFNYSPIPLEKEPHAEQYKKPETKSSKWLQKDESLRYASSILNFLRGRKRND